MYTVYQKIFAPIIFLPLLASLSAGKFKLGKLKGLPPPDQLTWAMNLLIHCYFDLKQTYYLRTDMVA